MNPELLSKDQKKSLKKSLSKILKQDLLPKSDILQNIKVHEFNILSELQENKTTTVLIICELKIAYLFKSVKKGKTVGDKTKMMELSNGKYLKNKNFEDYSSQEIFISCEKLIGKMYQEIEENILKRCKRAELEIAEFDEKNTPYVVKLISSLNAQISMEGDNFKFMINPMLQQQLGRLKSSLDFHPYYSSDARSPNRRDAPRPG